MNEAAAQGCAAAALTTGAQRAWLLSKALSRLPAAALELAETEAELTFTWPEQ